MTASLEDRIRQLEDKEEIRLLMARYHQVCDGYDERGTHLDPKAIADLFLEEGVWGLTFVPPAEGRAQIEATGKKLQSIPWILHTNLNPIVELDGDTARGEFKGIVRVQIERGQSHIWTLGIYRADLARTAVGWRFRSLTWENLGRIPEPPAS